MSGAVALPPDKRTRLVRLLGMLGSDFDGERAAAAAKADELVRDLGLTWDAVVASPALAPPPPPPPPVPPPSSNWTGWTGWRRPAHQRAAGACLRAPTRWTAWERKFLASVEAQPSISEKQRAILAELAARAGVRE